MRQRFSIPFVLCAALVPAGAIDAMTPAEETAVVEHATHALGLADQCSSMLLRASPLPLGEFDVVESVFGWGSVQLTVQFDAPFTDAPSVLETDYTDDESQISVPCQEFAPVTGAALDHLMGALHRHSEGIGVLQWGVDLGGTPASVSFEVCLTNYPTWGGITQWDVTMSRQSDPQGLNIDMYGTRTEWADVCLEWG